MAHPVSQYMGVTPPPPQELWSIRRFWGGNLHSFTDFGLKNSSILAAHTSMTQYGSLFPGMRTSHLHRQFPVQSPATVGCP